MRAFNFNAGPSAMPASVVEEIKNTMFDYEDAKMSVMEMSHRGKHYDAIHYKALNSIRKVLDVPEDYDILLLQGGASLQFAMIPMNFLKEEEKAAYILSGSWSDKALQEAERVGNAYALASTKEDGYRSIPNVSQAQLEEGTAYVHLTSNNTIYGTQWQGLPQISSVPVFVDASSDIFSRRIDWNYVDCLYAGAQKNAGPSGVTVVIMKKSLLEQANDRIPKILNYKTHADKDSLYNTPPTAAIYMLSKVMDWIEELGGIENMETRAEEKAGILYDLIDGSNGFYQGHATKDSRSLMNVTFTLADKELEKKFIEESQKQGFVGLKGHRSVGGCRASIYNAVPKEHVEKLAQFMAEFKEQHS